jgi:hypothetical protein
MTIRHAAAFAIVGWYLMVPPAIPGTAQVDQSAPLSQWKIRRKFPHNQGCETAKARLHDQALAAQTQNDAMNPRRGERDPELHCILCQAQCVEDSDSRLKPQ